MPQTSPSALLKVQGSSKLAFGATTAALVTLASGGTALLVSHVAHTVTSPTSLPGGALPPDPSASPDGLVVGHPAGAATSLQRDPTERALHEALTAKRHTPRRILTAPLVPLTPTVPVVPPTVPVTPPVTVPVTPPVDQPVTQPAGTPTEASREIPTHGHAKKAGSEGGPAGRHKGRHAHHRPAAKGKHAR